MPVSGHNISQNLNDSTSGIYSIQPFGLLGVPQNTTRAEISIAPKCGHSLITYSEVKCFLLILGTRRHSMKTLDTPLQE